VAREFGMHPEELRGGRRHSVTKAKLAFIQTAMRHGHRMTDIAAELLCTPAAITQLRKRKS
jgi:hypothetical protein